MAKRGFDPISRMIDLAEELERNDQELGAPVHAQKRLAVYSTLAKFYAAQPKSIDVNVKADNTVTYQVVSFKDLIEQRRDAIPIQAQTSGPSLIGALEADDDD